MISGQFTARINEYLSGKGRTLHETLLAEASKRTTYSFRRQLMVAREDMPGVLRMSSGGQCIRKQWFRFKGVEGEPLTARTLNTFLMGDICEVGLSILGRLAGWQLTGKPDGEDQLTTKVGNMEIHGHPDDLLFVPEESKYYLLEYKTMSEYSYRRFEKEGMDETWGYLTQCALYCRALGVGEAILVGMCKNTGHITDHVIKSDMVLAEKADARWRTILDKADMPDREHCEVPEKIYNRKTKTYDETGRATLDIVCQYCPFKKTCWGERLQMDMRGEKPNWILV